MSNDTMSDQLADVFGKDRIDKNKKKKISILRKWNKLRVLAQDEKDGIDHINVSLSSKDELGKFLSTEHIGYIYTPLGRFANMDIFMRYINTPGMPFNFNDVNTVKSYFKRYKRLNLKTIDVPNYWAMVTAGFICKIKENEKMEALLKGSNLPFTSYRVEKPKSVLGSSGVLILRMQDYRARYIGVIEEVRTVLKRYENVELQKIALHLLIMKAKDDSNKHLYDSVPFVKKSESTTKEATVEELEESLKAKTKEIKVEEQKQADLKKAEEERKKNDADIKETAVEKEDSPESDVVEEVSEEEIDTDVTDAADEEVPLQENTEETTSLEEDTELVKDNDKPKEDIVSDGGFEKDELAVTAGVDKKANTAIEDSEEASESLEEETQA